MEATINNNTIRHSQLPDASGYLSYYGLRAMPFRASPEQKPLWLGKMHRAVLAILTTAIREGPGIILLTGEPGTGKTSLANALIDTLRDEGFVVGRVPDPGSDSEAFFQAIADAYGISGTLDTKNAFTAAFEQLLVRARSSRKKVLLIVDEAQGLGHELLGEIADLSALGMLPGRSLAILLVGQTELNTALSDDRYVDLTKRIIARCTVNPLLEDEIGEYVRHCLKTSGAADDTFSVEAIRRIASISRGAPGVINIICDRALRAGHKRGARIIGWEIIEECFGKLGLSTQLTDVDRQEQQHLLQLQPSADEVGARRGTENGSAIEEATRNTRVRSTARLSVGLLAGVILVAASYSVYTFIGSRHDSAQHDSAQKANPSVETRGPENAVEQEAPLTTGVADVPQSNEGIAVSIPKTDTAKLPARRASPELRSPAPKSDASTRVMAEKPKPAPPRGSATPAEAKPGPRAKIEEADGRRAPSAARAPTNQAREREADAPDPAAIIDWLVNEYSPGRR